MFYDLIDINIDVYVLHVPTRFARFDVEASQRRWEGDTSVRGCCDTLHERHVISPRRKDPTRPHPARPVPHTRARPAHTLHTHTSALYLTVLTV